MNSRFEKLYSLPSQLYAPSMPVIIVAGALLKDTQTGKMLAQLKFKSISPKTIKAVTVSLLPLDTANQPLGKKETHQILDLAANRDAEFGQKTPLYFSNNTTRAYQVIVEEVIFSDNTVWKSDGAPLSDLPAQETAQDLLSDAELVKQYKLEYGERADYAADTFSDLWRCNCGAVNHGDEQTCHSCGTTRDDALTFDIERLNAFCRSRLAEEREAEEKHRIERDAKAKKQRRLIAVSAICICIVVALVFALTKILQPMVKYNAAVELMENKNYDEAIEAFMAINGYKDSETQLTVCYNDRYIEKYGEEAYNKIRTAKVGDIVTFGAYEQDNNKTNGSENIEWIVVDKVDGALLLVSVKALDSQPYNKSRTSVTWEDCSLRRWLNNYFLNSAFGVEEQTLIQECSSDEYPTADKVFLLDGEIHLMYEYGDEGIKALLSGKDYLDDSFLSGERRKCFPTEFAVKSKCLPCISDEGTCWWLLRWPRTTDIVPIVDGYGDFYHDGCYVDSKMGIRPALWIKLMSEVEE